MKTLLLSLNFHPTGDDLILGLVVSAGLALFIYCWSHLKIVKK